MINLDEVDGLFGPMLTTASSASVSIVKDNQVPMVAPSTTGTEIANISDDGYFTGLYLVKRLLPTLLRS